MPRSSHECRAPWRTVLSATGGLLTLLTLTVVLSMLNLGPFALPAAITIAATKSLVVAVIFMDLRREPATVRLAAGAGLLWIALLLSGTLADVLTR
jgi:cytochrome c oxidase subunit 4